MYVCVSLEVIKEATSPKWVQRTKLQSLEEPSPNCLVIYLALEFGHVCLLGSDEVF